MARQEHRKKTLVQCACEEGIVQIRRKSLGEPYELTLLPRAPDLYIPRKTCRTTLSMDLLLALMERSDFAWLCDTVAHHETSTSETAILERQLFGYSTPEDFAGKGCWISVAGTEHPP